MKFINTKKLKNHSSSLLNGGLYSLFSFFNQGASFFLLILLANYIQPAEYGMLSMFNTFVQLVTFFIGFSTSGYISVSYFSNVFSDFRRDFVSIMLLGVVSLCIISVIVGVFNIGIADMLGIPPIYIWLGVVICMAQFVHNINLDIIRIQEKIGRYGLFSCGYAILNFILSLVLVISFNWGWQGRALSQLWVAIIFGVIALYSFGKSNLWTGQISMNRLRIIVLWGLPLIPHLAANWIKQGCDRLIINNHYSMDEVGIFSFALNLTSIITMVGFGFNQVNSVDIYKVLGSKDYDDQSKFDMLNKRRRNIFKIYVVAYISIVVFCVIGVPILLPRYSSSILYFIPLSIYGFGVCIYLLYCNFLFYFGENKRIMMITFSSSIIHLLLSLLLTRYSLLLTSVIYVVAQVYIVIIIRHQANKILHTNLTETYG